MKVYAVLYTVSNDTGDFTHIKGTYADKSKALSKVKEIHDEILRIFGNQEDEYKDGDEFFEIYDSVRHICRSVNIEETKLE